jgi:hypothetical protein
LVFDLRDLLGALAHPSTTSSRTPRSTSRASSYDLTAARPEAMNALSAPSLSSVPVLGDGRMPRHSPRPLTGRAWGSGVEGRMDVVARRAEAAHDRSRSRDRKTDRHPTGEGRRRDLARGDDHDARRSSELQRGVEAEPLPLDQGRRRLRRHEPERPPHGRPSRASHAVEEGWDRAARLGGHRVGPLPDRRKSSWRG